MIVAAPTGVRIGPDGLPEHTLGWQILQWTADYLLQPDGPDAGKPWRFTDEQARFVLHWYAVDEHGRFAYRYGMLRRMKGWGKDPVAAVLACVEFVGPCRFRGWSEGKPYAQAHSAAWVQVAAVSKDQTRNTMTLFPGMLSRKAIEEYGIDLGKEIIYAHRGRCRIEAVTSSPRALEGGRASFVIKNESHHWIQSNEGHEMAAVIARNTAKSRDGSARVLAISNAHAPGEDSDAERDWDGYQKDSSGVLYDSLESAPAVSAALRRVKDGEEQPGDMDTLERGLRFTQGDSNWLNTTRLLAEILDPRTAVNTALRFYYNIVAASEERAFDLKRWNAQAAPRVVADDALITIGFDGSEKDDHTVLIGTEVETGYQFVLGYWEPVATTSGEYRIPVDEVDAAVTAAFERYNVWRMYADPYFWVEWVSRWAGRYGKDVVIEVPTNSYKRMAVGFLAYHNAVQLGELTHDGDARFATCIRNAHKHEMYFVDDNGEKMWVIQKDRPLSPFKIDAAVAGCLSWMARNDAIASGALAESGEAGVFFA